MIIEVGFMLATYAGVRLFEKQKVPKRRRRKRKVRKSQPVKPTVDQSPQSNPTVATVHEAQPIAPKSKSEPFKEDALIVETEVVDQYPKLSVEEMDRYSKIGLASTALFAVRPLLPAAGPLGLAAYIYSAVPYMRDVEKALLKEKRVNVDVLFFLGDALTLAIGQYVTAGVGLYMMHSGKMSLDKAKNDSKKMISNIFEQLPQSVWLLVDGEEVEVPLEQLKAGDHIAVGAGGVIPADGSVVKGVAAVDQHALTGESQLAEKGPTDLVFANTVITNGRLVIRVEKSGAQTTASQISEILFHATELKSSVQLKGEAWADKATLPMLGAAMALLPVLGPVPTVVFINSHIGNRIRILAPLGTLNHISHASRHGILVKDGRILENLHEIDTVLFDKTGTLTEEEPTVHRIIGVNGFTSEKVLVYAAAAEMKQTHPIARAILKRAEGLELPQIDDANYKLGFGITVHLEDKMIRVGSIRFLTGAGLQVPDEVQQLCLSAHEAGHSLVLVAVDERVAGAVELQPTVRVDAAQTIRRLREQGVKHIAIVSGDHREPTRKLAESLGMDEFFHDVLPEDKANLVTDLQEQGRRVCFVGDGINDAIAMKKANASVSISGATTLALDVAEIVLMNGQLVSLNHIFDLSKGLEGCLKKSLKLTMAPGVVNLGGAFLFHYSILTAMAINLFFGGYAAYNAMGPIALEPPELEEDNAESCDDETPESPIVAVNPLSDSDNPADGVQVTAPHQGDLRN